MKPEIRTKAIEQLAKYGVKLTENDFIEDDKGPTRVQVKYKNNRFRAEGTDEKIGNWLLWSGPDLGNFLERFWFFKPL